MRTQLRRVTLGVLVSGVAALFGTGCVPVSGPGTDTPKGTDPGKLIEAPVVQPKRGAPKPNLKMLRFAVRNTGIVEDAGVVSGQGGHAGSAWSYAPNHYVTAAHVVRGRSDFIIESATGNYVPARVVEFDPYHDLAVLDARGLDMRPLPLASSSPRVGDGVVMIGYPGPDQIETPTVGVMTAGAAMRVGPPGQGAPPNVDWFSITIDHGNSGGPALNLAGAVNGEVIQGTTSGERCGMAVDISAIRGDLARARRATAPVSTGSALPDWSSGRVGRGCTPALR